MNAGAQAVAGTVLAMGAGGLGATARLVVDGWVRARWPTRFPWATLVINVSGSLLLGLLTGLVMFAGQPHLLAVVAGTGFCGGYTTFSTATFETVRLLQQRRFWPAAVNGIGTPVLALAAAALGLSLIRLLS